MLESLSVPGTRFWSGSAPNLGQEKLEGKQSWTKCLDFQKSYLLAPARQLLFADLKELAHAFDQVQCDGCEGHQRRID